MRTVRYVILAILLSVCGTAFAQEDAGTTSDSLDREITVVGRDETALPIPAPWTQEDIALPELDPERPTQPTLPAIPPPSGDWLEPSSDLHPLDPPGKAIR
jgi:hypothetical protein